MAKFQCVEVAWLSSARLCKLHKSITSIWLLVVANRTNNALCKLLKVQQCGLQCCLVAPLRSPPHQLKVATTSCIPSKPLLKQQRHSLFECTVLVLIVYMQQISHLTTNHTSANSLRHALQAVLHSFRQACIGMVDHHTLMAGFWEW